MSGGAEAQSLQVPMATPVPTPDVTVIGGGLAGMAACLHLAASHLRVVCIEPQGSAREPVGESLDWSSPDLLAQLGFSMDAMTAAGWATFKRGVTLSMRNGESEKYAPSAWLSRPPINMELRTLHVDRQRLDRELLEKVRNSGIHLVCDRAVRVERQGRRVAAIVTANGARFASPWFLDASGSAKLLGREFRIPADSYGPKKVALWAYFPTQTPQEGTTIYSEATPGSYLDWIWEIPISRDTLSVGYVTTGVSIKQSRREGLSLEEVFRRSLARFPRFEPLLHGRQLGTPKTRTFQCATYRELAGPNWMIVGEAGSMVDPITSNSVTAALRHAAEASEIIARSRGRDELPHNARMLYTRRAVQMGRFFNSGIEKLVYDWPARDRLGMDRSARIYTAAAFSLNALYSRIRPRGVAATFLFGALLDFFRAAAWVCNHDSKSQGVQERAYGGGE